MSGKKPSSMEKSMRNVWNYKLAIALGGLILMSGCYGQPLSTREKGTFVGGILGAGTGALIGSAVGHPAAGAAIGGALGVGTGMLVGNELQNNEVRQQYTQHEVSRQQRQLEQQRREMERLRAEQEVE
jgi:outer membrane lipoprotein SlyB